MSQKQYTKEIFVKDYFDEPHYDELTSEETVEIRWDKDE